MKTFRLNTLIISLSLIAVIGIMGVGYAQWKDDVEVSGNISTGHAEVSLNQFSTYASIPVVSAPGEVKIPFTITNTGTVPMTLESKSDNIEFDYDELLPESTAVGFIITHILDGQYGSHIEELSGNVSMVVPNNSWSQDLDIIASVQVNIPKPLKQKKKDALNNQPVDEETVQAIEPAPQPKIQDETSSDILPSEIIETPSMDTPAEVDELSSTTN